jgi:LysM repeat protein
LASLIKTVNLLLLFFVFLVAPLNASQNSDAFYKVRSGDYLSRIASHSGVSVSEIQKANKIKGDVIHPGDSLKIPNPMHNIKGSQIKWSRPFNGNLGEIARSFGTTRPTKWLKIPYSGTDVKTSIGTKVISPANGVVRYVGIQDGYGMIVIIEHGAQYASVFGPLAPDSYSVKTNQIVLRGDKLGVTGNPIIGDSPYLHLELRKNNKAIDPKPMLR